LQSTCHQQQAVACRRTVLTQYGSSPDMESAERKISELKKFPQYTKADLVASKQSGPNAGQVQ